MQAAKQNIAAEGAAVVVISFAEPQRLAVYQRQHQWPFPVLADPARRAYAIFGLERLPWHRVFSLATLKLYFHLLGRGKRLERYGRDDYYQGGGDFLVDRHGNVLFAHQSNDPADRPAVSVLIEEIRRHRGI